MPREAYKTRENAPGEIMRGVQLMNNAKSVLLSSVFVLARAN